MFENKYPKSTPRSYSVKFVAPEYLDCEEKLLLMIFLSMRNLPSIHISVQRLAHQSSLSVPTVQRKLKTLISKGLIKRNKYGEGKKTVTEINDSNLIELIKKSDPKNEKFFESDKFNRLPVNTSIDPFDDEIDL